MLNPESLDYEESVNLILGAIKSVQVAQKEFLDGILTTVTEMADQIQTHRISLSNFCEAYEKGELDIESFYEYAKNYK